MQQPRQYQSERLRRRFEWLRDLNDDEVSELSRCEEGTVLRPDEEYFDVSHPERGIIRAGEVPAADGGSCYVAKGDLRPGTWQRLINLYGGRASMNA